MEKTFYAIQMEKFYKLSDFEPKDVAEIFTKLIEYNLVDHHQVLTIKGETFQGANTDMKEFLTKLADAIKETNDQFLVSHVNDITLAFMRYLQSVKDKVQYTIPSNLMQLAKDNLHSWV